MALSSQQMMAMGYKYNIYTGESLSGGNSSTPQIPTLPTTPTMPQNKNDPFSNTFSPQPTSTSKPYTPEAVPTVNSQDLVGGIRSQLTSGSIDGEEAKKLYSQGLAQQYGADIKYGNPQFSNFAAQDAYQKTIAMGYGNLFHGLGDIKSSGQYGEYNDLGGFARKSTAVNKTQWTVGGGVNTTQALKGPLNDHPIDYASTLPAKTTLPTIPKLG